MSSDKSKQTAFDRATSAESVDPSEIEDTVEGRSNVPRAVFTRDYVPDPTKLQIAQLRIAQGMTEEVRARKANIGQFVLTNYAAQDKVILIPFDAPDIRQYKPDPKKPAVCHAPTGDFGFGTPGGVCELCPLSQWGEYNEVTKKSKPPACKEGVLVRAFSITHRALVDFIFLAGERNKGGFIQQQGMTFGWSQFAIEMTSTEKSNAQGAWFVPQIEMLTDYPEEHRELISKWYAIHEASKTNTKQEALQQLGAGSST